MLKKVFFSSATRGKANYGWLEANYSFSFANFFDPNRIQFGLLRVLNDDRVAPGMGFGTHPHQNMEIITIPLKGVVRHQDSMGNIGEVNTGEIQVMSAGSGVEHSEMNASKTEDLKLFQIWIFPDQENVTPRYDQKEIAPLLVKNKLNTILKPKAEANDNDLWIHQNAYISLGEFSEDTTFNYQLSSPSQGVYFMNIEGGFLVLDTQLHQRDALGVWGATDKFTINASAGSKLLAIEIPMN